jgi:hypothetical protein
VDGLPCDGRDDANCWLSVVGKSGVSEQVQERKDNVPMKAVSACSTGLTGMVMAYGILVENARTTVTLRLMGIRVS